MEENNTYQEEFIASILFILKQYKTGQMNLIGEAPEKFYAARKGIGIDKSEQIIAVISETTLNTGRFGIAICESGICWRESKSKVRRSLTWHELKKSENYIKLKLSKLHINEGNFIELSNYSHRKLFNLIKDCLEQLDNFQDLKINPDFNNCTYNDEDLFLFGFIERESINIATKSIKEHRYIWGFISVMLAFSVTLTIITPATKDSDNLATSTICKYSISAIFGRDPSIISAIQSRDIVYLQYSRPDDGKIWKSKCKVLNNSRVMWASNNTGDTKRWRDHPMDTKVFYKNLNNEITITQIHYDKSQSAKTFSLH
jgi:hypothetical protein